MNKIKVNNKDIPTGYGSDYHKNRHQHLYTNSKYYKVRSEIAKLRYFNNIDGIENKKILEFGAGLGQNLSALDTKKKVGYDISEFAVKFSREKGVLSTTDITRIPDNTFDIVFSAHVLEHVDNPLETLRVMRSKLRKDGRLILITPLDRCKKIKDKNNVFRPDVNQHLWTWTPQLMTNLLVKAGFKPVSSKIIHTFAYKKLLLFRKLGLRTYDWATRFAGVIARDRELKFEATKVENE